jgi:hypothetical protein
MFSPLVAFPSLHQPHVDHVFDQTSVAARHILRPDPPLLSEHSSEHCHRASPLSPVRRPSYESLSIRSSRSSSTSTTSSSAFIISTPITPTIPQPPNHPILHQSKNTDKDESTEGSDTNTMAPKTNYYPASHSSSDGDRVHYNPRREERERSTASSTKKRPVVITYGGKTQDPVRPADIDCKRWK